MNYTNIYNRLMDRARSRDLSGYKEIHHVVPRCMEGSEEPSNLVNLTPEEHYVAHQLLVKMYPSHPGLSFAATTMTQSSIHHDGNRSGNKLFGWLRRAHAKNISRQQTGTIYYNNPLTNQSIRIRDGEEVPDGFVKGRGYSPTKGISTAGYHHTPENAEKCRVNAALGNQAKWKRYYEELEERAGLSMDELVDIIAHEKIKGSNHKYGLLIKEKYNLTKNEQRSILRRYGFSTKWSEFVDEYKKRYSARKVWSKY